MRRTSTLILVTLCLVAAQEVTWAQLSQFGPRCNEGKAPRSDPTPNESAFCEGSRESKTGGSAGGAGSAGGGGGGTGTGGSRERWVAYYRLVYRPEGGTCVAVGWMRENGPTPPDAAVGTAGPNGVTHWWDSGVGETVPPCPPEEDQPAPPGSSTEGVAPGLFAARYWETVPLPRPGPYIAPGWAITGKWAFLETRGTTTHSYTNPSTPFGALVINATGRYYVDWGDGTTTGPHSMEGKPWPEGEVRHIYTHRGSYDVVVTERWTATWELGGQQGVLRELRTTGRIDDFSAKEVQAVIVAATPR